MRIVIQCAASKNPAAGSFRSADGRHVLFLAHPEMAPHDDDRSYARPDAISDDGRSWRERLLEYNEAPGANPLNLLPAYQLYSREAYRDLVEKFGVDSVFILSAGWGLIPADFLTPDYDITFTASADPWKRRRKGERYDDFCLLPDEGDEITFLGGKEYLPLFFKLTAPLRADKTVIYNSARPPVLPSGFKAVRYETSTRTNWHYECARDLVAGRLEAVLT